MSLPETPPGTAAKPVTLEELDARLSVVEKLLCQEMREHFRPRGPPSSGEPSMGSLGSPAPPVSYGRRDLPAEPGTLTNKQKYTIIGICKRRGKDFPNNLDSMSMAGASAWIDEHKDW